LNFLPTSETALKILRQLTAATLIAAHLLTYTIPPVYADDLKDYSLLATNSMHLKKEVKVLSGFVGVNDRTEAPDLVEGYELSVDKEGVFEEQVAVKAPAIHLKKGTQIKGDVYYRDNLAKDKEVIINGSETQMPDADQWPLVTEPVLAPCEPDGTNPVTVAAEGQYHFEPSALGQVTIGKGATIDFAEGQYHVQTLDIAKEANVHFNGSVSICVEQWMKTGKGIYFGPDADVTEIVGADIQINVLGEDYLQDSEDAKPTAIVILGKENIIFAQIKAPNGTIEVNKAGQLTGSLMARDILIEKSTVIIQSTETSVSDIIAPEILNLQPADGTVIGTDTPTVSGLFSDDNSGIDVTRVVILFDGVDVTAEAGISETGFTYAPPPLTEGPHDYAVDVHDLAGNPAHEQAGFTVQLDVTPPEVTNLSPENEALLAASPAAISASFTDADSGVDAASVVIVVDNTDVTPEANVTANGFHYPMASPLSDGLNPFSVALSDLAGNSGHYTYAFTVDTTPPEAAVTIPADGSLLSGALPAIFVQWSDETSGIDVTGAQILLDGADITSLAVISGNDLQVTPAAPLPDGLHHISITISDLAGHAGQAESGFTTDTAPPEINNLTPADNSTVTANAPTIFASFYDATSGIDIDSAVILVDGIDVTLQAAITESGFTYVPSAPLVNGPHTVDVTVRDIADHIAQAAWGFQVLADILPPTISNIFPVDGSYLSETTPTLSADFSDDLSGVAPGSAVIMLGGIDITQDAVISATGFTYTVTNPLSDAQYVLHIDLRDYSGNSAQAVSSFTVDSTAPAVSALVSPEANTQGWNSSAVTVTFLATDNLSGVDTISSPVTLTTEGAGQPVNGSATDRAGNTGTVSLPVNIDQTPPLITITAPEDGAILSTDTATVEGTVSDLLSGVQGVECNGVTAVIANGTFTCNVPLIYGANTNTIVATVTDRVGHTADDSRTVTLFHNPRSPSPHRRA